MLENVNVLYHSSIVLKDYIYIDPYKIKNEIHNAKYVFITHSHYDHFDIEDIKKVMNDKTVFFVTKDCRENLIKIGVNSSNIKCVFPNEKYKLDDIMIQTVRAYNVNKEFHKKDNDWVGYIITIDNIRYFIPGDTDINEHNKNIKCDVLFVPIGGTYTMDYIEGAKFANGIKPKYVIPIHYNSIVGTKEDGDKFKSLLDSNIKCYIYL